MIRTKSLFVFLALALFLIAGARAQEAAPIAPKLDEYLGGMAKQGFTGAALVAKDGKVIISKGYGMANAEWDIPNTPLPVGERMKYNNSGYFMLGYIIEIVSGRSYEAFLQENIFTPLKMADTGYDTHDRILKKRATGYSMKEGRIVNSDYKDMSVLGGCRPQRGCHLR